MLGKGLFKGLAITFKHTFERDITVQYPEERPLLYERFRGCLAFNAERCIVCGLCIKACPNNVLSYETRQKPGSKKKQLASYTIDLQYCMFCNLCVEACSASSLYFTHDFELSVPDRDAIKIVYVLPETSDFDQPEDAEAGPAISGESVPVKIELPDTEPDPLQRRIEAFKTAISKNPAKALAKLAGRPEDLEILIRLAVEDEKKTATLARLMAEDMAKAAKVAGGLINKARKDAEKEGETL